MTKRLYALSDEGAARLRQAIVQLVARQLIAPVEVARSRVELAPLDQDAAVERMARALHELRCCNGDETGCQYADMAEEIDLAQAALNALLQDEQS